MLRGGHEPGARIVRDARLRPALERGDERVVRQVLGETDVAGDAREPGDELGGLDPPHGIDRAERAQAVTRSEEHTSELQSQSNLVCRLLLEKKKKMARDTNLSS